MGVDRLAVYVSGRGPAWYAATSPGASRSRREVLRELLAALAALGERAGTGQPPRIAVPALGDHALADQLLVLGHELAAAPGFPAVSADLDRLVAAARTRL